jgi:DNA-binding CsgD family transcriptional regulator/tetratricopeptide (TPR) repeat protein
MTLGTCNGSPLVEREAELSELRAALDDGRRGAGCLAVISGGAGAGKSTLLRAATDQARERGMTPARARGSELEQELSFGVIRQLFSPLLRSAAEPERAQLLSGAVAAAARLFDDAAFGRAAGLEGGFATLHGLYWLTAGFAAHQALLLAVDDLQWVDAPSLRALNYLAARASELPMTLVVTVRTGEPTTAADLVNELVSHPEARGLNLASLRPAGVAAVVRAAHPDADDALCAAFHEASAGNPFYLHELLRSVAASGRPTPNVREVREAALATVADRVLGRLRALGPAAPALGAAMAVLGSGGRLQHAAAVAGHPLELAAEASLAMRRAGILAAEDPFEWIHPLVRRSIYDNLTVTRRDRLHARAAEVLADEGSTPSETAVHLAAQRPAGSARVVAGLMRAADEALARDAPEVAAALLRRALDEGAAEPPRSAVLLRLGQVEVSRRSPEAIQTLEEALRLSTDPRERALAAMGLGEILTNVGQFDAAGEVIAQARAELDGSDTALVVELEVNRALIFAFDPARADELWSERERLLAMSQDESWAGHALAAMLAVTFALRGEDLADVPALCDRALEGGRLFSERGAGAWASSHVLGALATIEAYERTAAVADDLELAARGQGSVANALVAEGYRGWTASRRGDLARSEEIFRPLFDTARVGGMFLYLITALWWMQDAIIERPSLEDLAALTESLDLTPPLTEVAGGAWPLVVRGRIRAARGDRARAAADLRAAGRIFEPLGFGPLHDPWRSSLALVLPGDEREEARSLVEQELDLAERTGFARPRGIALRAAGLLAESEDAIRLLRESVDVLADSPARYEHARSQVELGAALRRAGRKGNSRPPLAAGMELAYRCGAERLVGRAREELLAAGARPRRIVRTGVDGLTASERRVARLAAEGRSNPEIAQALYVSVKTVETHLSNVYTKLELSGPGARRRLPQLMARTGGLAVAG